VAEYVDALGYVPRVELRGPLDSVVPANVRPQLLATVREGLSNVTRHAEASRVDVQIVVLGREVVARITDDGVGISWNGRESGLGNLRSRAATVGGSVQVQRVQPNGTQLEFRAPLVPDAG
jgi:signal transduction histidine kinase